MNEIFLIILGGAIGALIKDILDDESLKLPTILEGKLHLGFLSGTIIGAFVGYIIDGSFLTAAMAGYTGFSVIEKLVPAEKLLLGKNTTEAEQIIRMVTKQESVDADLAVRVAKCESRLDCEAVNTNADGSRDRGLFQINSKWHPDVTDAQAFDPIFSTQFFCKAFKAGNLSWWKATKGCWKA